MAKPSKKKSGQKSTEKKPVQNNAARQAALRILLRVLEQGESLSTAIPAACAHLEPRDRSMVQAMVYGVLRWRWKIEFILKPFLKKPLKDKDLDVKLILMLGVFQLLWMRTPDYALVDAAVKSSLKIKKSWAKGLVNAVLRNLIRQREELTEPDNDEARYSFPQWMIDRVRSDWPDHWQSVLEQSNEAAPMTLRVDTQQTTLKNYQQELEAAELKATPVDDVATALVLEQACDVHSLPGFDAGRVSVQDGAAQLAASLLQLEPGQRVLDACAAPGGKTVHMLQAETTLEVDAVDIAESRLDRVEENLQRLSVEANLIAADIAEVDSWWDGRQYDRILLDAPCSASGVIRRHPDIKSLRRESDIDELVKTQQHILQRIWPLLKPGGLLLYATCSIFRDENEKQLSRFLQTQADAAEVVLDVSWGHAQSVGRQILSGENRLDGFYYALLQKQN